MQNNIPTLYILELDSSVVKSARISTMLCPFVQKFKKKQQTIVLPCMVNGNQLKEFKPCLQDYPDS